MEAKLNMRKNYKVVIVASLLTLIISSYMLYNGLKPETRETEVLINHYSALAYFRGGAEVKKDNPIWPNGSFVTLPVYSYSLTPEYRGEFYFTTSPKSDVDITVETSVVYFYEVNDVPVWKKVYFTATNSSKGEIRTIFEINVSDLKSRINDAQNSFGVFLGKTGAEVIEKVKYSGIIKGREVDETLTFTIPVDVQSTYYSFSTLNETKEFTIPEKRIINVPKPFYATLIPAAFVILSAAFLIASILLRIVYKDVKFLEKEIEAAKRDRLIKSASFAKIPETNLEKVEVETVEDIFKAANENLEHIFYDRDKKVFFFVHGGVLYYCREK
ncbi:MAG: hypothetical protein H0Z19_06265 [Archaeoglobus sp.]|uniref:DUF5305 family protein n=1 Tax=Archaeoglobus sp. TaxID=1872626 RepID=UPI001D5AD1E8|nr:DUF5305 family protein [Archaeoglobus sp.]MBO8180070.1 hypothetical protein [Archaeoglobus sp.]